MARVFVGLLEGGGFGWVSRDSLSVEGGPERVEQTLPEFRQMKAEAPLLPQLEAEYEKIGVIGAWPVVAAVVAAGVVAPRR